MVFLCKGGVVSKEVENVVSRQFDFRSDGFLSSSRLVQALASCRFHFFLMIDVVNQHFHIGKRGRKGKLETYFQLKDGWMMLKVNC